MATDANGTPTSLGIPKLDTANDAPSGLGINAMMDAIDALIAANPTKPSGIVSGEVPVWNGTTWVRSSVTRINTVRPQDLAQDGAATGNLMAWDGSKWAPAAATGTVYDRSTSLTEVVSTAAETTIWSKTILAADMSAGKHLRFTAVGDLLKNNVAGDTLAITFKFGAYTGVARAANADGSTLSATRGNFVITVNIGLYGASAQIGVGRYDWIRGDGNTSGATFMGTTGTGGTVSIGSNVTASLTAQWSAASANNSFRTRSVLLELI